METVRVNCGLYGPEATVFSVEAARAATTLDFETIVASALGIQQERVVLYLTRGPSGRYLPHDDDALKLLRGPVSPKYTPLSLYPKNTNCFTDAFAPDPNEIHLLVQAGRPDACLPPSKRSRRDDSGYPRPDLHEQLWQLSKLEHLPLQKEEIEAALQRPLPVALQLENQAIAQAITSPGAHPADYPGLATMINAFVAHGRLPTPTSASEASWQSHYDDLMYISKLLLSLKGIDLTTDRNRSGNTTTARQRPDLIAHYRGLVLLRAEEKSGSVGIETPYADVTRKMSCWNPMFYGKLPYTLGYATSGATLNLLMIDRGLTPVTVAGLSILSDMAGAVKLFYNLAFLLDKMIDEADMTIQPPCLPFTPQMNSKRTIEVMDGGMKRTIRCKQRRDDFARLEAIYRALEALDSDSTVTHLQTVEELTVPQDLTLVVKLRPLGYHRQPRNVDEVSEWLQSMLTALKTWHACGYYHGDVSWNNIVYVTARGTGS